MSKALFFIFFLVCFYDQSNAFHLGEESNNNFYSSYASRTPKRSAVTPDIESSSHLPSKPRDRDKKFSTKLYQRDLEFKLEDVWDAFYSSKHVVLNGLLSKKPESFDIDSFAPSEVFIKFKDMHPFHSSLLWQAVEVLDTKSAKILLRHGANPYKKSLNLSSPYEKLNEMLQQNLEGSELSRAQRTKKLFNEYKQ